MKIFFYSFIFLAAVSFTVNAQPKISDYKWKNSALQNMYKKHNFSRQHLNSIFKINPYWQQLNVHHLDNSFIQDIEVPDFTSVWGSIGFFDIERPATIYYVRTGTGGYSWKLDSLPLSTDYGINSLSPLNAYTCYAAVANVFTGGGGIYKTNNGGVTWRQLSPGQLFDSTSYPDFVHFFDEKHGVALGDGNGPGTPYFEIYTTGDAGITWERVSAANIPAPNGFPFSFNNGYTVAGSRIWFQGFDSNGGHFIYRSDDYGHHWQAFPVTATYFGSFAFADKRNGVANGFDENGITQIYSTHNGGETWEQVSYSGIPMGLYIAAVPGTSAFVTTSSFATAIFGSSYSKDYGKTWTLIDSGANALHNDVKFLNPLIGWSGETEVSSSDPGGMYKWKYHFSLNDMIAGNTVPDISSVLKNTISDPIKTRLYPNPAKNVITVNGLNTSASTEISLYNNSGTLIQQATANGENHSFNIQQLAAGSYYIKIQSGNKTTTLKFVKE